MKHEGQLHPTPPLLKTYSQVSWVGQCTSEIPALGRLREEEHELEACLGYKAKPSQNTN